MRGSVHIVVTGLNHRSASLAIREALTLAGWQLPAALARLREYVDRGVILATCNRTEVYFMATNRSRGELAAHAFIADQFAVDPNALEPSLYIFEHAEAVQHLYRVASSLDSLILGESEILGQVRDAYSAASASGLAGGILARVFHNALRVGKRARSETSIGRNALSVSRAAVELTRRLTGDLTSRLALIIGVGEASRLAGQALQDAGVSSLVVVNRTPEHGKELARELNARVAPMTELESLVGQADIVVSSTAAGEFVLHEKTVRRAMERRPDRHLILMDMAMPRDVEPEAADIPGVHVYTMYDLELVAEANRKEREAEAAKVNAIVEEEVDAFRGWWRTQEVTPTIAGIREHAEAVRSAEVSRALKRLNGLGTLDRDTLEAMSRALVNKLLHNPTRILRERNDQAFTETARELFGVGDE